MIKIENTDVQGFEAAVRGARNPMNSWDKSDSCWGFTGSIGEKDNHWQYLIGENDLALAKKLVKAGTDHSKFMRFITVTADITAPLYWWREEDTYKIGTVTNSCSTMHTIHKKEFELSDFSCEKLLSREDCDCTSELMTDAGNPSGLVVSPIGLLKVTIDCLNNYRKRFLETKDKKWWWQMIQLLPQSYNQKRTVMLNYQVLRNMYHARKNHKLDEWHDFCGWVETLPYSELITEDFTNEKETF